MTHQSPVKNPTALLTLLAHMLPFLLYFIARLAHLTKTLWSQEMLNATKTHFELQQFPGLNFVHICTLIQEKKDPILLFDK